MSGNHSSSSQGRVPNSSSASWNWRKPIQVGVGGNKSVIRTHDRGVPTVPEQSVPRGEDKRSLVLKKHLLLVDQISKTGRNTAQGDVETQLAERDGEEEGLSEVMRQSTVDVVDLLDFGSDGDGEDEVGNKEQLVQKRTAGQNQSSEPSKKRLRILNEEKMSIIKYAEEHGQEMVAVARAKKRLRKANNVNENQLNAYLTGMPSYSLPPHGRLQVSQGSCCSPEVVIKKAVRNPSFEESEKEVNLETRGASVWAAQMKFDGQIEAAKIQSQGNVEVAKILGAAQVVAAKVLAEASKETTLTYIRMGRDIAMAVRDSILAIYGSKPPTGPRLVSSPHSLLPRKSTHMCQFCKSERASHILDDDREVCEICFNGFVG